MVGVERDLKDHLVPTPLPWCGAATTSHPGMGSSQPLWAGQSITHCSLLLLPPQGDDFSHSPPAAPAVWGPSHGRRSSMNFSSVSPSSRSAPVWVFSPGCSPFRNRMLLHGSPLGSRPYQQTWSDGGFSLH